VVFRDWSIKNLSGQKFLGQIWRALLAAWPTIAFLGFLGYEYKNSV
jgi:hypothetical protein